MTGTLNIVIHEKRMLTKPQAASYLGLPLNRFTEICTVQPVNIDPGVALWDKRDLDDWIDRIKRAEWPASLDGTFGQ